jgi:hypothetical protein
VKPKALPKALSTARPLAVLAIALGFLAAGAEVGAATLDAKSLSFIPLRHYAGEELLLRAVLVPEKGERLAELDLKPGSGLPGQREWSDPEIRELKLVKAREGWLLELRFLPWSPGPGSLPAMRLEGFRLPALPYTILPLLGPEDRDPSPPRPQRELPGMALFFSSLAIALVLFTLLVLVVAVYLVPAARSLIAGRKAALAFKRFEKSLDYLVEESGAADPAAFFAALMRAFRLYLAARVLPEAPALTASELAALPETAFPEPTSRDRAAALVALADRFRFGGEAPRGEATTAADRRAFLRSAAEEARAIGAANEEVLLVRV